ncbi:MAG: hypothetical protein V1833_04700 [Elusimicrobiota bacterium]
MKKILVAIGKISALPLLYTLHLEFIPILLGLYTVFTGCQRNSTFEDTITFKGNVFHGHFDVDSSSQTVLIVDGYLSNANVLAEGFPDTAKTATDGSYTLSVKTVRTFKGLDYDAYTLKASASGYQSSKPGSDEKITTSGKPGDIITVRDFVLYKHTEE